jgi:sialic acid synthase SpsE
MKGSDHLCSLNVAVFAEMVKAVRILELGLGSPHKELQERTFKDRPIFYLVHITFDQE